MDTDPSRLASLAMLLRAELVARPVLAPAIQHRYRLSSRFQPHRAAAYEALSQALRLPTLAESAIPDAGAALPSGRAAPAAGPVLMVCESKPFEPDLDSLHDQLLLRLLTRVAAAGLQASILRLRTRLKPLRRQLGQLPAKPAVVISVGVADQACLELLRELAPVVRLGMRSMTIRPMACVQYDAHLEAAAIASYAAARKIEQMAFVGPIDRVAGRRCLAADTVAALSNLAAQAQGRHIAAPSHLTFWVDAGRDLRSAGVLSKVASHMGSGVLAVVSGADWARELAQATGIAPGHILCRHWSAEGIAAVPVIGPDLDQLAEVLLARALAWDALPNEAAVLVPPVWHRV